MKLDPTTLILVSALTGLFLPIVLLGLSRSKETRTAVETWTRAVLIYASGLLCLMLRNVITDPVSIGIGNALLLLGYLELYQGFRLFFGRAPKRTYQWPVVLVYLACMLYYLEGPQSFEKRVILASAFLAGASLAIGKELLAAGRRNRSQVREALGSDRLVLFAFGFAFAANSVFLLVRGIAFSMALNREIAQSRLDLIYAASFLIAIFVHVLLSAGLPLLLSRRTQRELTSSEASLLRVQQVGRVAYGWVDIKTRAVSVNQELRELLGFPPDLEVTLEIWLAMIHPDETARMEEVLSDTLRGTYHGEDLEFRVLRYSDRQEIWVSISSQVQSDPIDGHPVLLSILHDITNMKRSELSAIREKDEAEQSSKSKSQFLANMSHEIRTPINAILGMLSLLDSTALTSRQRDFVGKAEGAAKGLLGLVNDILDFSKVGAGKMRLDPQPFRLDQLLRNLAVVLTSGIRNKQIEILFDIDPQLPPWINGDSMRLQQVLINLGGNAVKFTETGHILITLKDRSVNERQVCIAFSVQDTGIGIAPEHQQQIFEAFSQAEASTTRRYGGTGLGLAISKYLVELMGGTLQLQSTPGVGTTFSFEVAFDIPEQAAQDSSPALAIAPTAQRVLIVDDNPLAGQLLKRMMTAIGWQCELKTSGEDALAFIAREMDAESAGENDVFPFQLVLMDWQMPAMDGWEATRRLRELTKQCSGPPPIVIMVSASGRQDLAQRSEEEQALVNGFLVKPVTAPMVMEAFTEAASDHRGIRRRTAGRASKRQLAGMRILVVEDNLLNQQVAEELLTNEGALVSLAANGQLGVEAVQAASPQFDVVLMDIQMPVMDGYEATGVIRKQLGLTTLPIIAMTANAMSGDREACMAAGMNEHIGKPFDMARLISQLIRSTGFQPSRAMETPPADETAPDKDVRVEGMDLPSALQRMSNTRSLYIRTARDFMKTLPALQAELQLLLQADSRKAAAMVLHTLKGNAGTLGLPALAAEAARLEALCRQDDGARLASGDMQALEQRLSEASVRLTEALHQLGDTGMANPSADGPALADRSVLVNLLAELAGLLEQSDMLALERFAHIRDQLEPLPDGWFDRLDTDLQNLDLPSAHQTCLACMEALAAQSG